MTSIITGRTRIYMIVADPIHHVRTPEVFNKRLETSSVDAVLVAANVTPDGLASFVEGARQIRNLSGLIVTVPHKQAVVSLCDELSRTAQRVGSVNTIRVEDGRLIGDNFDGVGLLRGLEGQGYEVRNKRALLLGSGGAARAITFSLLEGGVQNLVISNRDIEKARQLAASANESYPGKVTATNSPDTSAIDLIINATSLGMRGGDLLPLQAHHLLPQHMVAEVVMAPEVTPLLSAARANGANIHLGKHMLDAQMIEIGRFLRAF